MTELWLVLTPILLADVLNPVLFAYLVYLAGSARGAAMSVTGLLGHTAAYFGWGIVIAIGFDRVTDFMEDPGPASYGAELILGLALLWLAWTSRQPAKKKAPTEPQTTSLGGAFVTGAIINFIGMPFAVPYFAAIDQILKADLEVSSSLLLLAGYNLLYTLPFLIVPVLTVAMGQKSRAILERLNQAIARGSDAIMPVILFGIGVALTADGALFFARGSGLF